MQTKSTESEDMVALLKREGYLDVKYLSDGTIIAVGDLIYTRAIFFDCDRWGYGKRYCFEDRSKADSEFARIADGDDEPVGFIARRPE